MNTENNKLIAEFMSNANELKFDTDWNLLMKVVEKIESLEYSFEIVQSNVVIKNSDSEFKEIFGYSETYSKIEAVYLAVVKFIEWYNSAKN